MSLAGRPKHAAAGIAAIALTALLAACSSSGSSSTAATAAGGSQAQPATLTWATSTVALNQAVIFVAMGNQNFKKYNLTVKFTTATSDPSALTTGAADVIIGRASDPLTLVSQGKPTKVIAANAVNIPEGFLGSSKVKSIQDLAAMGTNCTIASLPTGNVPLYTAKWMAEYGLKCKVDLISDYTTAVSAVVAGRYDAAVENLSGVGDVLATGRAHWLIDPLDPNFAKKDQLANPLINSNIAAMASYVSSHSDELKRFMQGLMDAQAWMKTATNEQIAQAVKNSGVAYWQAQSVQQIEQQITANGAGKDVFQTAGGGVVPISEQMWNENLQYAKQQGLKFDTSAAEFSYSSMYDASILGS